MYLMGHGETFPMERWAALEPSDMHVTNGPCALLSAGASEMRDKLALYVYGLSMWIPSLTGRGSTSGWFGM